jgi:predicted permease
LQQRNFFWLGAIGRLKPGWTAVLAARQLETVSAAWFQAVAPSGYSAGAMENWNRFRLTAEPRPNGTSALREDYETSLWLLLGITGLVLMIACANLANLMLARAAARGREIAVRMALGASRVRVVTQLWWESLLIAAAGAAAGVALAIAFSRALVRFLSTQQNTIVLDLRLDWRVLAFTTGVALFACLAFGLSTAVYGTRARSVARANSGTRGVTAGRRRFSLQRMLIATQIAVSLVLVVASVLFVRSFRNLFTLDTGFRQQGIVFHYIYFGTLNPSRERIKPLQAEILNAIAAIPGVESVATSTHLPLSGQSWSHGIVIPDSGKRGGAQFTWVTPRYFSTMEIPILAGRDFTDFDNASAPHRLLVNETFVKQYFDGANPIGRTVRTRAEPNYPETLFEIIGVVKDTKYSSLRQDLRPIGYAPDLQHPSYGPYAAVITRSALPSAEISKAVREVMARVNPNILVNASIDLRAQTVDRLARERMLAWLAGFFGVLATLIAAIGLYGVVSYMIAGRRSEIGIRLALGATRPGVVWMVLRQTAILLTIGVVTGAAVSLGLARFARALLYGLEPGDPKTLVASAGALCIIAICAGFVPARRASRIDPAEALKAE